MTKNIYNPNDLYPTTNYSKIKITKIILNIDRPVRYSDVDFMKSTIQNHINDNLSPKQIAELYQIQYSDFGMFIKRCLGIKIKTRKEAARNYFKQASRSITDEKHIYWRECNFAFDPFTEPNIAGYDLLDRYKFEPGCATKRSPGEVYLHRDHMISKLYGYENNIPSHHISHPANCEIMFAHDNIKKNSASSITYEELLIRIENWNYGNISDIKKTIIKQPKSPAHKKAVSEALMGRKYFNDGKNNYWIYPDKGEIPNPLWAKGLVKK